MKEKNSQIREWLSTYKKQLLIGCAAAAAVILAVCLFMALREYDSYETVSSYEHSRESNDLYIRFGGKIVQYGGDGITCLNQDGSSLWSKSYEMEQPVLVQSDEYLAVADQGGSMIYLFDTSGFLLSVETPYPVRQLAISDNGSVAAVLEESDASRIMLYDKEGNIVVEGQAHLDDNGYPAAIALSADGSVLGVSYLTVSSGTLSSTLMFYDFSKTQNSTAEATASDTYEGEAIVRLAVIGGKFAAFSDAAVRIYGGGSLSLLKEIELTARIRSIVIGENRFALIYDADDEEADAYTAEQETESGDASETTGDVYAADLYGKNGSRISHTLFDGTYQNLSFLEDGSLAVLGTDSCLIITGLGQIRFSCDFEETICGIFANRFTGYTFVFNDRIENVRLN